MDKAYNETEDLIKSLEKRINTVYGEAAKETELKLAKFLESFAQKDKAKMAQMKAGEITLEEYRKWRKGQILISQRWKELSQALAEDLANADKIAQSISKGYMAEAYALNHNYATFEIEKASMVNTSYTLYDKQTVERLIAKQPKLFPDLNPKGKKAKLIKQGKVVKWNQRKITSQVTQAIMQGESIDKLARRMRTVADMGRKASIRNARTAMTGAQNAGRQASYERAQNMGIVMEKQWLAVMDNRTRHAHIELDGVRVPVDEKFENEIGEIEYPADPNADPANIYNCRCTMISAIKGFEKDFSDRHNDALGDMTYEEWKNQHKKE